MADRTLTHAASLVPIGAFAGKPAMPLSRPVVSVGSGKQNRIQLKSDTVSTTHALLVHTDAGWYVRDLGSRTHTILNGKVAREATLKNGDTLTIGAFVFHFVTDDRRDGTATPAPAALEITDAELPVPLDTKTIVIGRRQGCEVRLLEESASLVHAILFEVDGAHYVRDLYSRTGTFLNGRKVHQERLNFGDDIVVGETHLKYVADATVEESITPTPVESDAVEVADVAAPIAIADAVEIPLSPTARDTIDADRGEAVEADAPVLPLSRRDRFESLAPSEVPTIDVSDVNDAPIPVETTPDETAEASDETADPLAPIEALASTEVLAPTDEFASTGAVDAPEPTDDVATTHEVVTTDDVATTDDLKPTAVRSDPLDATDALAPTLDAPTDDASAVVALAPTLETPDPIPADAGADAVELAPTAEARVGAPVADAPHDDDDRSLGFASRPQVDMQMRGSAEAPPPAAIDERTDATDAPAVATTPDDDEADILGLAPPAGATHAVADEPLVVEDDALTPTAVRSDAVDAIEADRADALAADLAPTSDADDEATDDALAPVEAAQAIDEPAAASVVVASAAIDDALAAPADVVETTPDDDEADILGLAPPAGATHAVAPIDDAALVTPTPVESDAVKVDLRAPDVIVVRHVAAERPAPPAGPVAVDAPEPVDDFAAAAEAVSIVDDDDALPAAAIGSPLEPTATAAAAPAAAVAPTADRPATPAEAAALAQLEARVRDAIEHPSSAAPMSSLVSGQPSDIATQLGEATRRARVIAEVLSDTEGFEADAAKQPIDFADASKRADAETFADVPGHEATRVVDAGAGAIVASLDDAPAADAIAPLEFGDVPLEAALAPIDFDDDAALSPIDETVAPLALDEEPADEPAAAATADAGFARELGTPPGADEPVAPALHAGDDALVPTSSSIVVVDEHAAATLAADHVAEPVAASADDSVIDVVAVPVEAAHPPTTIRDAMPPEAVALAATPLEAIPDSTPTSLGELQSAIPAALLAIDSDVRGPVDLPVAGDERAVEVSDFRAPIEADAYRAGDVLGTSPIVGTGPTPEETLAAQAAEARAIEDEELAAGERIVSELAVDQAALDVADQRIDAPPIAASFAIAPEPHVEPMAEAPTSSTVDAAAALDLPTPLEHHARPLIAADDEHLADHAAHADVASIEAAPQVVESSTIDAEALTATVAESLAPVADEASSPSIASELEAVPSDAAPTILTETDDEIALAAGLPAHADVVGADAAASLVADAIEPVGSDESVAAPAAAHEAIADGEAGAHFDVIHTADEPTEVVVVSREQPRNAALDDAFADALAMAAGHTFAPEILPPQRPVDARLAEQWKLDESLLEQADHAPRGPIDPLAAGIHPAGVEGFLNLGGIGYIGDEATDEYEPATSATAGPARRARPRRQVTPPPDAATPIAEVPIAPGELPTDPPIDAELETLADAPTPQRKRPATPPRPVRRPPTKRGQAAVEESFASNAPTTHSPFAEQALPLVDAFGGQNDAFSQQPVEGLDVMLARFGTGETAGQVLDRPAIVADAPATSALDAHARPVEGRVRGPRPATPTPTPFASHVPINGPTPPRPRRPFAPRRVANKLPMLSLLLLVGAALVGAGAWYWPVPRTLQGQLTFENLDKLNTIERTKVQDGIRATLATLAAPARKRLDDRYGDGFLDRPELFRAVADNARFSPEDPNALVVRVASTVNSVHDDQVRLMSLLTTAREASQAMRDAYDKLVAEHAELQKKQDAATAQRDATQRQLDIARPLAATLSADLDALRTLDAEIAALDKSRQAAAQTLAAREADLRRLEAEAAAMGVDPSGDAVIATSAWPSGAFANFAGEVLTAAPIAARLVGARGGIGGGIGGITMLAGGGEVVAAPAPVDATKSTDATKPADELDQLSRDRDAAKLRLDQLLQSQSPAARQAREGFDQALGAFAGDVEAAGKSLGDRPEVLAYVQSARALQKQIVQMTDQLVHRQEQNLTRMNGLKSKLAEMNDSSREERYANDEQLKTWTGRLAMAQRRLNAARDANGSARDIEGIEHEVSLAESAIAVRKGLLDDPTKGVLLARDLESMIQIAQRDMADDRQQNERMLADITDAFRRQQPAVEQLPDDQKKLAQQLAGRLAQIDLARRQYTNSLGLVAGGEAQAIADARSKFEALDQQLTQRRAQVDASAAAQAAEMERRARIGKSLDDARTALIAARASRDQAERAYAAKASPRDALVNRIDAARHAGQQKDALDVQLAANKTEAAARIVQLDALMNRLKFAVYPKGIVEPAELPTAGVDPRLAVGSGGIVVLLCVLAPFILIESRRRAREMNAPDVLGDGHTTNFPPHATAA